jgi:hypothetical protein
MKKVVIILCAIALFGCRTAKNKPIQEKDVVQDVNDSIIFTYENSEETIKREIYPYIEMAPDKATPIDKETVKQCKEVVDSINSMQLTCDTILVYTKPPIFQFKGIYFDKESRLRNYFLKEAIGDGAHDAITLSAYYDGKGNLVYITCESGSNCEDDSEYYYVHDGKIVDFMFEWYCGCCEDDFNEEHWNFIRPVVGNALIKFVSSKMKLTNFIHADTLLKILKNKEYERYIYDEFEE